ncbi:MAG: extracellular solute-binding protein [bacterium]|nr:extracellular solute-binding protein [bacterium]
MKRALLLLFSCLWAATASAQTLHFWQFWPEEWLRPQLDRFTEETGIQVEVERLTWSEGLNKILTSMAAGQAPDVIEIGSTWVAGLSEGLAPINPGDLTDRLNGWSPARYQGSTFAVPWTLSTAALYVNLDLLDLVGEPLPQNWADLLRASQKIQQLDDRTYGYGIKTGSYSTWQKFLPFAWSKGSRLLYPDGRLGLTEAPFVEALEYYKQLKDHGLFDDNTVVRKVFLEGHLGFMLEEPGQIERFNKENPDLRFGVIPLPPPVTGGASVGFSGGQMLAVTQGAADPQAALKLIHFLCRPEVTEAITRRITTLFPAHKAAEQSDFYQKEHRELLVFLEVLKNSTAPPSHPKWVSIQEVFSQAVERSLYGLDLPQEAMRQAELDLNLLLNEKPRPPRPDQDPWGIAWMSLLGFGLLGLAGWAFKEWRGYQKALGSQKAKLARRLRYRRDTLVFLAPWLLVFVAFSLYPIVHSIYLSFTDYRATDSGAPAWVGMENYSRLVVDPHFLAAMGNSFFFVLGTVPVILVLAVVLAVILNQKLRFKTFYRVSYFMPVVTSVMVIAALFVELYAPQGLLNDLARLWGSPGRHWLKDPNWALPSIMLMNIWASFGFYCLMLLAGLQSIPEEYYEASSLEGAGALRQFFTITLPLLKPTLLVAAVMDSILAFQVFGEVLLMTKGGPLRSSETAVYYLYDLAFHKREMGYGSAAAYLIFLVLLAFTAIQLGLLGNRKAKA